MEYVYAALLLDSAGKEIKPAAVKKVLTAAGAKPDEARIKALVASLEDVDIKEAVSKAAPAAAAAPVATGAPAAEEKKEKEEEEEEKVSEEEAAAGLGALFG